MSGLDGVLLRRQKPMIVETVLVTMLNFREVAAWCNGTALFSPDGQQGFIQISTRYTMDTVRVGDYIIKDKNGRYRSCTPANYDSEFDSHLNKLEE